METLVLAKTVWVVEIDRIDDEYDPVIHELPIVFQMVFTSRETANAVCAKARKAFAHIPSVRCAVNQLMIDDTEYADYHIDMLVREMNAEDTQADEA